MTWLHHVDVLGHWYETTVQDVRVTLHCWRADWSLVIGGARRVFAQRPTDEHVRAAVAMSRLA